MAKTSKRYTAVSGKVDRARAVPGAGCVEAHQGKRDRQVQRIGRRRDQSRHRREEVRPGGARLDRAAARHGQDRCASRCSRRATRRSRRAMPAPMSSASTISPPRSRAASMDFDVVDRDAGRDARRRPARPDARSARSHAEPESRHGHAGRRARGEKRESRPGAVSHRQGRHRPVHHRARFLHGRGARTRT